jgi:CheY-like chemotaxis protein
MSNRILVVEDETLTSEMLRRYFEMVGYEVVNALTGGDAIKKATEIKPSVIILDINLPDIDGYEVCRRLRSDEAVKTIPIIFLTTKDDRRDRLAGLELGADDFLTKPFDVEELRLRVHNIIGRMGGTTMVDARTSLPSKALIQERLPGLLSDPDSVFIEIELANFQDFSKKYGPVAANQVIRSTAKITGDMLHEIDPRHSFLGHPEDHRFLIGINSKLAERLEKGMPERFSNLIKKFYSKEEIESGTLQIEKKTASVMNLTIKRIEAKEVRSQMGVEDKDKAANKEKEKEKVDKKKE